MEKRVGSQFRFMAVSGFIVALMSATQLLAIAPKSFSVEVGSSSGSILALAKASESKVVNLYTNRYGNLRVAFQFDVAESSSSLSVAARFKQDRARDVFTLQAQSSAGSWVSVGTMTGSTSYQARSFQLPAGAIVNKAVKLRLISSAGADDFVLDSLDLAGGGVVAPSPAPTTSVREPASVPSKPAPAPSAPTTSEPVLSAPAPSQPVSSAGFASGSTWYWQLMGALKTSASAKIYDIDLFDTSAATIASLKASGRTVVCYFSAGSYEEWRPDASQFPAAGLGSNLDGWPGERWLDVRNTGVRQIMAARLDLAKSKGCDAVEPDNVDGYANSNGVGLTQQDQVSYNTFLADQAHARGLKIALKNATDLVNALVDKFDFAVVEECFKYNECEAYSPFIAKNKAVLNAEYTAYSATTCSKASNLKFSTVFFNLDLDGNVFKPCP